VSSKRLEETGKKPHTSRNMRWVGYVACTGEAMYKIKENINQRDHLNNLGIDVKRTLKTLI
jgi:hypothetical protein